MSCLVFYTYNTALPTIIHLGAIVFYRHAVTSNNILVFSLQSSVRTLWESSSIWKIVSYQLFLDISCGQSWTRVSLNWITILHFALWLNSSEPSLTQSKKVLEHQQLYTMQCDTNIWHNKLAVTSNNNWQDLSPLFVRSFRL